MACWWGKPRNRGLDGIYTGAARPRLAGPRPQIHRCKCRSHVNYHAKTVVRRGWEKHPLSHHHPCSRRRLGRRDGGSGIHRPPRRERPVWAAVSARFGPGPYPTKPLKWLHTAEKAKYGVFRRGGSGLQRRQTRAGLAERGWVCAHLTRRAGTAGGSSILPLVPAVGSRPQNPIKG